MESLLAPENWVSLALLILLQAVLGFDNLLYISLESKRAPLDKQQMVRRTGILLAMVFRIVLLFLLINVIKLFQDPFFHADYSWISATLNLHVVIVFFGGIFILYTAMKEIWHMVGIEAADHVSDKKSSAGSIIAMIVVMNVVFSFDSILSAMALTDVFWVMAVAIMIGAALMLLLADRVSEFLEKNRAYEVLGLFVLFVVGIMLLTEGAHLAHLKVFGNEIHAMTKTTFYFVIFVLVCTDVVQGRYQKKLMAKQLSMKKNASSH